MRLFFLKFLFLMFVLIQTYIDASDSRAVVRAKLDKMQSENRTALIIGNNRYSSGRMNNLKNPISDAKAMRELLSSKGFEVIYAENATKTILKKKVKQFGTKIAKGGVGLFYFSGHGIQVDGDNYLVASDSDISDKDEVEFETLALNYVTKKMKKAHNRFNILILDACRNNPFNKSAGGGLAPVRNARGIFVAYATEADDVAQDGKGKNSPFTTNLIKYMKKPLKIGEVFTKTREAVYEETNHEQVSGVYNQSIGDFYFTLPTIQQSYYSFNTQKLNEYTLSINTTPSSATVKITNIVPKYYNGISLKPATYNIEVSKQGYHTKTGTIELKSNLNINIKLEKKVQSQTTTFTSSQRASSGKTWRGRDTNLIWQVKIDKKEYNWSDAKSYCSDLTLDGRSDWRLPNRKELNSIMTTIVIKTLKVIVKKLT